MGLFVSLTTPTKHFDSIIIYIGVIIASCLIHFVICVTGTTALGSLFEELGFSSSASWLTNDFVKRDTVSCRIKKKKKKKNRN